MKRILSVVALLALQFNASAQVSIPKIFASAEKQTDLMVREINKARAADKPGLVSPRTLDEHGNLALVASKDWCSGFFPGELWYLYEFTGNEKWRNLAETFTGNIEQEKTNGSTHDMGFKVYCSVGNAYRLTKNAHDKDVIIDAAKTLASRFNPTVGCIKSWDNRKNWQFPVIIDNMLNLELLFAATRLTGDSSYYKIAVSHALTTMKNHFRPDYSSFHVVNYEPVTGAVLHKQTHQGYADGSAWSRGQAWGLYGYTMCYRETKNKAFLLQAERVAGYILNNRSLPADLIPYWDYNAPNIPNEPRDVSAATVTASGLYELSTYSKNSRLYKAQADKIIANIAKSYTAKPGEAKGFILLHSTGSKPSNTEVDEPLSYADYYYLEALLRRKELKAN